jgi:hypothetical protein
MTTDEQYNEDRAVLQAMVRYGGSFMKFLGEAGFRADSINLAKIKRTWPEDWEQYREMAGFKPNPHRPQGK